MVGWVGEVRMGWGGGMGWVGEVLLPQKPPVCLCACRVFLLPSRGPV